MGSFTMLITAMAFIAGALRNELALTLFGTVFLTILVYCFLSVFVMGLIHRKRGQTLSMTINTNIVDVGKEGELSLKNEDGEAPGKNSFWGLPAVLVRCELCLATRDGRVIRHYVNPGVDNYSKFSVKERGAYFSDVRSGQFDRFVVFDAPGFFRLSFPMIQAPSPRLLAVPSPAEEIIPFSPKSGGAEQRYEPHYLKSDELTDHRPYVPGDDPRRINWKLYGHAPLGELFVREGEPEPPPHSRLLLLIDTEADRSLFTLNEARRAVDQLCEYALAAAIEFSNHGMDILIGYTGGNYVGSKFAGSNFAGGNVSAGGIIGGREEGVPLNAAELAAALAMPATVMSAAASTPTAYLPTAPGDRSVLILALPRTSSEASALDAFLTNHSAGRTASFESTASAGTDIFFIYNAGRAAEMEEAARTCVNMYNRCSGVRSEKIAVLPGQHDASGGGV